MEPLDTRVVNTRVIKAKVPDNSENDFGLVDIQVNTEFGQ